MTVAGPSRVFRFLRGTGPLLAATLLLPATAVAGTWNPDRAVGDVVPAWSGLRGTDGREHGWDEFAACEALVVVFTCNGCPYATDHEARIDDLATRYAAAGGRVAVVALNPNQIPEDSLEAMTKRAGERRFHFPYLADPDQAVARSFGALRTPEFFVLDGRRRIVYMGSLDDDPEGGEPTRRYVEEAVDALLAGRVPETAETAPVGCLIRSARRTRDGRRPADRGPGR